MLKRNPLRCGSFGPILLHPFFAKSAIKIKTQSQRKKGTEQGNQHGNPLTTKEGAGKKQEKRKQ